MKIPSILISVFLFCCVWITNTAGFMSPDNVANKIVPLCYQRRDDQNKELPNGQVVPLPNTLETFVSLLEKIEHVYPNWNIEDIILGLLVNFRYDDLQYTPEDDSFKSRNNEATTVFDILKEMFGNPSKFGQKFADDDFTDDEKCALYFMISHTVDSIIREGDEIVVDDSKKEVVKFPRELGVVMLNSNMKHSFALGKVLLGMLAGLKPNKKINALNIYKALAKSSATAPEFLKDIEVDILYTAAFGDLIALSVVANRIDALPVDIFLPNGWWNDADCPLYYNLASKPEFYKILNPQVHSTYASMRGAIDGYVLGEMIQSVVQNYRNIRLSQILRAYYNNEGLYDGTKESISWCLRQAKFDKMRSLLQNEALSYHLLYSAISGGIITNNSRDALTKNINNLFGKINSMENEMITDIFRDDDTCTTTYSRQCETDTKVFVIMDYKTPEVVHIQQREMFGNLTTGLQVSHYGSTASIYTNLKPSRGNELEAIVNYTTFSGCPSCAAKYYKPRQTITEQESSVFRYLNYTLTEFDKEHEEEAGVPAKVLLYFNFASPNLDDWQLRDAFWTFRRYHRDVKVLAVGKKDSLKLFVQDESKDILTPPPPTNTEFHKSLKEKVCKVPAIFQYKNCHARTDSDELNNKYEGFITPKHVQYWAMYPKHFLKSYGIKLTFQATRGQLKVCFSRYYSTIFDQKEPPSDSCKETSNSGENAVHFYVNNPCHKYSEENCRPFYFYIEGKTTATSQSNDMACTDVRCKTPDQIQFEFVHQGISCNKGSILSCSLSVAFYAALGSLFWFLSLTKY